MPEQDDLIRNLQRSALFQDVDPAEVERLIAAGQWRTVEQGRYVYRQGESDCRFHIIADGEAELTMDVDGGDQFLVSRIGPGGHFGETALLTNSTHSIDVRALTALSLLCFDAEAFNHELLANQVIQRRLCIGLARRLRVSYHDHAGALAKSRYPPPQFRAQPRPDLLFGTDIDGGSGGRDGGGAAAGIDHRPADHGRGEKIQLLPCPGADHRRERHRPPHGGL